MEYCWGILPYESSIICIKCDESLSPTQQPDDNNFLFCFNHGDVKAEFWEDDDDGGFQFRLYKGAAIRLYRDGDI
jgi:hypothetical protein